MTKEIFDVAIIGAGPTGGSLALGLAATGLKIALIDARPITKTPPEDGRNFAIVAGSWHHLDHIGLAQNLISASEPLRGLEAVDGGTHWFGRPSVMFTDADLDQSAGAQPLGYMVRAEVLQAEIDKALSKTSGVTLKRPCTYLESDMKPGFCDISLSSGDRLKARLLVGADGIRSSVREQAGITVEGRDYEKSVFTANVELSEPHQGIARQLFMPEGPFATLPLQGNRANIAWYMKRGAAEALANLPVHDAEAELNARFAEFSGPMKIMGKTGSYPLILQIAKTMTAPRTVLIGDAARRVNPLAGQGLNQGFRDIAGLQECLSQALETGLDIGSASVLEGFQESRRFDSVSTAFGMDAIDRLFSNDSMLTKPLRALGLLTANRFEGLRRRLAERASGTEPGVPPTMTGW